MLRAFAYNVNLRVLDEGRKDVTQSVRVHEIGVRRDGFVPDIDLGVVADASSRQAASPDMEPVVIYPEDEHGVTVSAILVQHAPVFPALGYRFDTPAGARSSSRATPVSVRTSLGSPATPTCSCTRSSTSGRCASGSCACRMASRC